MPERSLGAAGAHKLAYDWDSQDRRVAGRDAHIKDLHEADSDSEDCVAAGSNAVENALHDTGDDSSGAASGGEG